MRGTSFIPLPARRTVTAAAEMARERPEGPVVRVRAERLPRAVLMLGLFALSVVCLLQLQRRYATAGVLVSRCGSSRLCQARDMILRAKAALDNKAKAELMLLKVRAPCGPHRALRLLRAPSDRFRAWQSGQGSGMRVAAALVVDKPRGKAREQSGPCDAASQTRRPCRRRTPALAQQRRSRLGSKSATTTAARPRLKTRP